MKSVYCLNPISNAGMSRFDDTYCIADSIENADAVLLRSASMHEITLAHIKPMTQAEIDEIL